MFALLSAPYREKERFAHFATTSSLLSAPLPRPQVRLTSKDFYDYGSLWVFDANHLPYGCSVWPAFWTKGPVWPDDGEIGA